MKKITSRVQIREMIVGYDLQNPAFLEEHKERLVKQIAWKMYDDDFVNFQQEPMPGDIPENKGIVMTASCFVTKSIKLIEHHINLTPPHLYPDTEDELFDKIAYSANGLVIGEVGTDKRGFFRRVGHFIDYIKETYPHYSIEELLKMYNYGDAPYRIYHFTGHNPIMQVVYFRYLYYE